VRSRIVHVISRYRHGVNEIFAPLGCHIAQIGSYQHFRTAYPYPLQGSSSPAPIKGWMFLGTFAELWKVTISFSMCLSIHLHGKTQITLDGFSLNLISEYFLSIGTELHTSITSPYCNCLRNDYIISHFWHSEDRAL